MDLFLSMDGRIGRGKWWLGLIGLVVVAIVLSLILTSILGQPTTNIILMIALIYPSMCIYSKRLHDRDKPNMPWLWIFIIPSIVYNLASMFGIGFTIVELQGQQIPIPGTLGYILLVILMVVGIWALIEMGFLRGTRGDNQFGPDPVGD